MERTFNYVCDSYSERSSSVLVLPYQEEEIFQCYMLIPVIVYVLVVGAIEMPSPRSFLVYYSFVHTVQVNRKAKRKEIVVYFITRLPSYFVFFPIVALLYLINLTTFSETVECCQISILSVLKNTPSNSWFLQITISHVFRLN